MPLGTHHGSKYSHYYSCCCEGEYDFHLKKDKKTEAKSKIFDPNIAHSFLANLPISTANTFAFVEGFDFPIPAKLAHRT